MAFVEMGCAAFLLMGYGEGLSQMDDKEAELYSWFLGPKAENADVLERLVLDAIRDCAYWRRNFQPQDEILITEKIKKDDAFQDSTSRLQHEFFKLLAELKNDTPFYSPRYIGHMLGDQLLPAIVGYFAAMLHNPNNVTREASPITTEYETQVAKQLASLVGYNPCQAWGHIASGGSIANFEALWVARNLKYFPLAARAVARSKNLDKVKIKCPSGEIKKLIDASGWELLNLPPDRVLRIRNKLYTAYGDEREKKEHIDDLLKKHSISGKGIYAFLAELSQEGINLGKVLVPATAHYSWTKVVEALGIGSDQIKSIAVNEHFRMDIGSLRKAVEECVKHKIPIITIISVLGTTEEGAVDHVHEIIELQKEFKHELNYYHHCDAAWGGYVRSLFYDSNYQFIPHAGKIVGREVIWHQTRFLKALKLLIKQIR
jgi:hypothetical protein